MKLIESYALMWPRKLYSLRNGNQTIKAFRDTLENKPGIYVLYKGEEVFYIGQVGGKGSINGCLYSRIGDHALNYQDEYSHSWDHFSAFIVTEAGRPVIDELEGFLQFACPRSRNTERILQGEQITLPTSVSKALKKSLFIDVRKFIA